MSNKAKKVVGIITMSNSTNYGGILQAVALSTALKKNGVEPINIQFGEKLSKWHNPFTYVKKRVRLYGAKGIITKLRICGGFLKVLFSNVHYISVYKKQKNFGQFIHQHLITTPFYSTSDSLKQHCSNFDVYVTGSDQVWNNAFSFNVFQGAYFLDFAPSGAPCYSYAASAGGKKSDDYIREIIARTKDFKGITVREKSLENDMRRLGCDRVHTVLDPTLLLDRMEWEKMAQKPKKRIPEHYILLYYLEKDPKKDPIIRKISNELKLPVIDIMPNYGIRQYPCIVDDVAGPAEFLYYVNHADFVVTNSFHMVVFSLIFQKKFVALKRAGQESRILDLLKVIHGEDRYIESDSQWKAIYEDVPSLKSYLEKSYQESMQYLYEIGGVE